MSHLANNLIHKGYLKTDRYIDAFSEISRAEFLPEKYAGIADANIALPIGHGQIAPSPQVLSFMIELLQPQIKDNVLIVGSGTGWVVALMSYIVGSDGHITAIEEMEGLEEKARKNIAKYSFIERDKIVKSVLTPLTEGFAENAPYDRILAMHSFDDVTESLKEQLGKGGTMVVPISDVITYFNRNESDEIERERFDSVHFSVA